MAQIANDPQLVLKVTPPRIPKTVLERGRLSSARAEFSDKAVILLHAPTGSGKTALLAQWRKEALQTGAVVVWVTLDQRDHNNRLVRALVAAMRSSSGRPAFGVVSLRAAESDQDALEGLTSWLAELAESALETLLILDDIHALPEATLNTSLPYLLLNAPSNLRIVLASRKSIDLPLAELPSRGSFAALSAKDLRFDQSETVALLKARFGQKIDPDSCIRLHDLTEGWPLGVQLAVSTIERSADIRGAIAAFSVQGSDIGRYFVECLVKQLPPQLAQTLVYFSFVETLSPGLCAAILQQDNIDETLSALRDLTPIFTQGVNTDWVRIHPLAREFLQERFAHLDKAEQIEYHGRAGLWLAQHGCQEQAARHLFDAGREDIAYDLIERSLYDLLLTGQVSRVSEWIERMPMSEIEPRPRVRITLGWLLAQSERHAEAVKLVGSLIDDETIAARDRLESAEICATAAVFADDIDLETRMVSSWQGVFESQTQSEAPALIAVNHAALLTLYRGSPDQARFAFTQFSGDQNAAGRYPLGWRDWIIGYSYLWEGQVQIAVEQLRVAVAKAEAESGRRSPIAVTLAAALATAMLDCNQIEDTAALLADRLDILERRTPPEAIAMGFIASVRLAVIQHEEQRAFDLLDYLLSLGEARKLPRLCIVSLGERIRLHAVRGRGDICAVVERKLDAIVAALEFRSWGDLEPLVDLQLGLAHAYAAIARYDWARALELLEPLYPIVESKRKGREAVQIFLLRALARKRCGEDGTALMREGLAMAKLWGFARIAEDTHPDLADWARLVEKAAVPKPAMRERDETTLLTENPAAKASAPKVFRVATSSLLSPKEREVLQLLAGNMTNKQIALAMGVSDETIKWHLKNLFGKLNAGTRKHLLDRARMMGILDTLT